MHQCPRVLRFYRFRRRGESLHTDGRELLGGTVPSESGTNELRGAGAERGRIVWISKQLGDRGSKGLGGIGDEKMLTMTHRQPFCAH